MPAVAHADEAQPWAAGVSAERKAAAQKLLDEGNLHFVEKKYTEALASYRSAIAQWDHPAIRFNIVRSLIQLERWVEADENLKLALQYDKAPLEDRVYDEAVNYRKLLAQQVVDLELRCTQPDVKLTLDGAPVGTCPLGVTRRIEVGRHQVVGVKAGFLTKTEDVFAVAGERHVVELSLVPLERAARIEHRWPTWMPWVVFGGGLTVAGIGGLVQLKAAADMRAYDRFVGQQCTDGCRPSENEPDAATRDLKSTAELENKIGITVISIGAAAAVTGGVLLYLNRGRTVYPTERARELGVTPTPGGAAVTWGGRF